MNVLTDTLAQLNARGDQAAIINQADESISFKELHDVITKFSFLLKKEGVSTDSRVLILAALDWPLYAGIASLFQLGATVVLIDPWASNSYIEAALSQVNPTFLIISRKARVFLLKKAIRRIPKKILIEDLLTSATLERTTEVTAVDDEKTALITFTSGTTGVPKGFDRTHGFLRSQQEAHDEYFEHKTGEIDLTMYPVFVLSNLKSGMTSVLIKGNVRKIDALKVEELYHQIEEHQVQSLTLSPVILEKLLRYCREEKKALPVQKVFTGGAPVKKAICEDIQMVNPQIDGRIVYGSTEAEPIALIPMKEYLSQNQSLRKGTPLGRVVSKLRWKLVPLDQKVHPYHDGEVGDVYLTGPFVGKKYWNNEKAFHDNKWIDSSGTIWHKTGDIALLEGDQLFMLGRKSFPVPTKDGLLFPVPIENQLDQLPGMKKSAYFSMGGKVILAYSGKTERTRIEEFFKREKLPVDDIIPLQEIPMDSRHRSKVDLPELIRILKGQNMLTTQSPLSARLLAYTKERFPLIPVMILVVLLTAAAANLLAWKLGNEFSWSSVHLLGAIVTIFLFMLQLRMSDEIKDYKKDCIAYPERLLSRGIITLKHVKAILYSVIVVEFILNGFLGFSFILLLSILQTYAYLMAKEFFLKEALEKRYVLYLVTHQLILIPLMIYAALPFSDLAEIVSSWKMIPPLLFLCLPYTIYELSRKTWSPDREGPHADSYTKFWGIKPTLTTEAILAIMITGFAASLALPKLFPLLSGALTAAYLYSLIRFARAPERKASKMVELVGSVFLLGHYALTSFFL